MAVLLLAMLGFSAAPVQAQQTQNHVLPILPAPGPVKINGSTKDWDLSGGVFVCNNLQYLRKIDAVWFFAMYDKKNVYLLAKWKDPTPLNNPESSHGGYGFNGDCLQVRFITHYKTAQEKVSHWTCWRDRDGISVVNAAYGRDFKGGGIANAIGQGAQQAFKIDANGKGYLQEVAIPWKLLTADGKPLPAGATMRMALEPNWTAGAPWGRLNMHDLFRRGITNPDRVFTFRAYSQWGKGVLEKTGPIAPAPVLLSDGRKFPVRMVDGWPAVNWVGLVQKHVLPGFKKISFDAPSTGYVSLHIKNASGVVVRQLLTANLYHQGQHSVLWDGLTNPSYKVPGVPVAPGRYSWEAIVHPHFKLTLRGWAASAGSAPWMNGPTTAWGGDHGAPDAVATDGRRIFLGWSYAEAGPALIACNTTGQVLWRVQSGDEVSCQDLAVDHGVIYSLGNWDNMDRRVIVRMRARDGVYQNWRGTSNAGLNISQLWSGERQAAEQPLTAAGLDVRGGRMYLSFSSPAIEPATIIHWRRLVQMLLKKDPLDQRILSMIDQRTTQHLAAYVQGKLTRRQAFGTYFPTFNGSCLQVLNDLIDAPARQPVKTPPTAAARSLGGLLERLHLVADGAGLSALARATANRRFLDHHFAGCLEPLKTDFIAVCSAHTGRLRKEFPAPFPQALHALSNTRVAFVSAGSAILVLDTRTGGITPLVEHLSDATNFAIGGHGRIYVAQAGAQQRVNIFTPHGRPVASIGRLGGRRLLGPWQADGMYRPAALAVDNRHHHLWVAESDFFPKRVSVWNTRTGKLVQEFFGPGHYGSSGGAIDPADPDRMVGEGCLWRIDAKTGQARCTGVLNRRYNGFAAFCNPGNGHVYLAVVFEVLHTLGGVRIYERMGPGDYRPCAEWWPHYGRQTTTVWSDINGDGRKQADEITTLPFVVRLHGSNEWSVNLNTHDFTLFGGVLGRRAAQWTAGVARQVPPQDIHITQKVFNQVYRINPAGFTACGAPKWDLTHMQPLPFAWSRSLANAGFGMLPSAHNQWLVTCEADAFKCYNLRQKTLAWSYPDPFYQVGASHLAPSPRPGLLRGPYGLVGTFHTPETGTVWCINGNCGEWYLLSSRGYYLGHLFQGNPLKMHFPDQAVPGADMTQAPSGLGGEDFGGSLTQAPDGKVYVEAGKTADWNIRLHGIHQVAVIGHGDIRISRHDVLLAEAQRQAQLQAAVGIKQAKVLRMHVQFTGNPYRDFREAKSVTFHKGRAAVRVFTAWDSSYLYVGWDVADSTPWVNGATVPAQMYMSGDTVDLQIGSDARADAKRRQAGAGDCRVSIGNFEGKPTAVLYRWVSKVARPMAFSSGVIHYYRVAYVAVMPQARIRATIRPDHKGYYVEAALPWSALGFHPQPGAGYRGDVGVTYGDAAGTSTVLRSEWNNQHTGLVSDAVFELEITPLHWGQFIFKK